MASRQRKERAPPAGTEELQLWHAVRTQLRSLERIRLAAVDKATLAEQIRSELVTSKEQRDTGDDYRSRKRKLDDICSDLKQKSLDEQIAIDSALEKLDILTALRSSSDGLHDHSMTRGASSSGFSTPSSRNKNDDRYTSGGKVKGSVGGGRRSYSTNTGLSGLGGKDGPSHGSAGGSMSQPTSSSSGDPARARREALAHQLPLQKGRKVAFRQPTKKNPSPTGAGAGTGAGGLNGGLGANGFDSNGIGAVIPGEEDGETWIMATVIECINNDRNRYVVQDAEEEGGSGPTWNTTLKAIVPLPESVSTLPPQDYPIGAQVMGLYPDTSCFYRATVKGGGPGITRNMPMSKLLKKEQELLNANYQLVFEDDNDIVRLIPAYLVVERPRS